MTEIRYRGCEHAAAVTHVPGRHFRSCPECGAPLRAYIERTPELFSLIETPRMPSVESLIRVAREVQEAQVALRRRFG